MLVLSGVASPVMLFAMPIIHDAKTMKIAKGHARRLMAQSLASQLV